MWTPSLTSEVYVLNRMEYDSEFREGTARNVMESGKPIAQVARDPGVDEGTLGELGLESP